MYRKLIWISVILWMALIFYLSHQPATKSDDLSKGIKGFIVENTEKVAPKMELNNSISNHIIRKNAHFIVYLVLGFLAINAFISSGFLGFRGGGLALTVCILYAISDEFHQFFVPGRGPGVKDIFIDCIGACVGIGLFLLVSKMKRCLKNR